MYLLYRIVRERFTQKILFEQRSKKVKEQARDIARGRVLGKENRKCKDPEPRLCLENNQEARVLSPGCVENSKRRGQRGWR